MANPLHTLASWIDEATQAGEREASAMALATTTRDGKPSCRIVLCRGIGDHSLRFFTNYESRKGIEIGANPAVAATFYWGSLMRQVCVTGNAARLPASESDAYFLEHRPRGHRLQSWASRQSTVIGSLDEVRARHAEFEKRFEDQVVPRPDYWGGFEITVHTVELWMGGADRLHERRYFKRQGDNWLESLLSP
jgi:pyridoxamine 5'-phosphate oxidase